MDAKTARDSLVKRDAEWLVAGQMTQQFLTELEVYYTDAEEGSDDGDFVDYNSFTNLKNYDSINLDGD
jgi:hypothetical protein